MSFTQDTRVIGVDTPLGKDVLLLLGISAKESLSESFVYTLDVVSTRTDIAVNEILGQQVGFWLTLSDGSKKHFNGYVSRFSGGSLKSHGYRSYQMQIVPWSWLMGKNRNFKIFQNRTVLEIIEDTFGEYSTASFQLRCQKTYAKLGYCVQYQESSLAFISRLMHENGIFYFFTHELNKHTLVLADNATAYVPSEESSVIQTFNGEIYERIDSWLNDSELFSGKYSQSDFNFESPTTNLAVTSTTIIDQQGVTDSELFTFPGGFSTTNEGLADADVRMAEEESNYTIVQASSNYRRFFSGCKFTLADHAFAHEKNNAYAITKLNYTITENSYFNSADESGEYTNSFTAIPADRIFFSESKITKPRVYGPQTAIVVGPAGEKVHTDQYGRVRVQFHWDRVGQSNESSSCWLRVSQNWAGSGWGSVALPHVGSEVIVSFLNGDPDQPIVTGRVHNAGQMPPEAPQENIEKNILQDDFGNKIVLDATDGCEQILLAGPVKGSQIEIGTIDGGSAKGVRIVTEGDIVTKGRAKHIDVSLGSSHTIGGGTAFSAFGGVKFDASIGVFGSFTGALKYDCSFGGTHTLSAGYTNAWTLNTWINATNAAILNVAKKDVITGAGDAFCFVANCNDPGTERSILYADDKKMTLSMGDAFTAKATGAHNEWYNPYGNPLMDVARLAGMVVASGLAGGAVVAAEEEEEITAVVLGAIATAIFLAASGSAISEFAINNRNSAVKPITHDDGDEALKIELNKTDGIKVFAKEKGILLSSGEPDADSTISLDKGIGIKYGNDGIIVIDDKGKISISSEADISIESKGNIDLIAKKKVRAKGAAFDFNGVLKHKNFKVLA